MIKQLFIIMGAVTMLGACTPRGEKAETATQDTARRAATFAGDYRSSGDYRNSGDNNTGENNTGDYRSTGDASLLTVKLPAALTSATVNYEGFTVYYNKDRRIPNCVAYELTATQVSMADAPDAERRSDYNFERDHAVKGCPDWWEYKNTGYDRGHMVPAMDMRWSAKSMRDCFMMTNMCPQRHELNDGEWRHMEEAIHRWARKLQRLVVITGPVVDEPQAKRIGTKRDIVVPQRFFKVVYAPSKQRAIAFLFDNEEAGRSWTRYAVTVDEVERATGYDFLSALPDDVERAVESKQNINDWPTYTPRR